MVEINAEQTVLDVKKEIEKSNEATPSTQKLIYKGKHLDDQKTMEELGVKDEDCFVLMLTKVLLLENSSSLTKTINT